MAYRRSANLRYLAVFLILFTFWLVFSGHYDPLHISLGLVCAAVVTRFSYDLLLKDVPSPGSLIKGWRFLLYVPWLLCQVVMANFHVVYLVIRPSQIRPRIVRFKTSLTSDLAKVVLGNSITLTPGTLTMNIDEGEFYVHAVSDKVATDLLAGDMERRVARVFGEHLPTTEQPDELKK